MNTHTHIGNNCRQSKAWLFVPFSLNDEIITKHNNHIYTIDTHEHPSIKGIDIDMKSRYGGYDCHQQYDDFQW